MKSGSECITVFDSMHTYDKKMGFASEKIKSLSSNTRLEEDKASYSRIQQESNAALRQAHHCFHLPPKLYSTDF